ncbi:2-phospho-L-lactate transferase [Halioxenophilus aromaticivorans]|uniref:2-phospho-L-lactate transferase n=1 Tax=Halioxenophilus aromaticivorans TaxID=1306992 RepID=UPI0031EA0CF6
MANDKHYLALCGGVGGAKLALGLAHCLPPQSLTIAVNIGDNFEHLGLPIWPDIDTVSYTLAGLANPEQGWGRQAETWQVMDELKRLGAPDWFALGDKDIALHLHRKHLLEQGNTAAEATQLINQALGVTHTVLPISNQTISTKVHTDIGTLEFQEYFVKERAQPKLLGLDYVGAKSAQLLPQVESLLGDPSLTGIIICPSNPYLSIGPMLAISGLKAKLARSNAPVLAVSPIIGGQAIKGPTAKIMTELKVTPCATLIADLYAGFVDITIIDETDRALVSIKPLIKATPTLMMNLFEKKRLAVECIKTLDGFRDE